MSGRRGKVKHRNKGRKSRSALQFRATPALAGYSPTFALLFSLPIAPLSPDQDADTRNGGSWLRPTYEVRRNLTVREEWSLSRGLGRLPRPCWHIETVRSTCILCHQNNVRRLAGVPHCYLTLLYLVFGRQPVHVMAVERSLSV